jgi:hypothetical protein
VSFHSYIPNWYIAENNFFYSGINESCDIEAIVAQQPPVTTSTTTTRSTLNCNLGGETRLIDCNLAGQTSLINCSFTGSATHISSNCQCIAAFGQLGDTFTYKPCGSSTTVTYTIIEDPMNEGYLSYLEACIDTSFTPIITSGTIYPMYYRLSSDLGCTGACTDNYQCACIGG